MKIQLLKVEGNLKINCWILKKNSKLEFLIVANSAFTNFPELKIQMLRIRKCRLLKIEENSTVEQFSEFKFSIFNFQLLKNGNSTVEYQRKLNFQPVNSEQLEIQF